ncbi:MAG: arginine--tRNA ligase [Candidatus Bathyarchaeia archaeon]
MANILQQFRDECVSALRGALEKSFPDWATKVPRLSVPPSLEFGELTSSIAHEIAREKQLQPQQVAQTICASLLLKKKSLLTKVESISGYVNFKMDYRIAAPLILAQVLGEDTTFGIEKSKHPIRVTVEHTSANPSGPLTMGHARNAILGDVLARLLKARGHSVNRRFYIDDMGRQVSILAYGYRLLKEPEPQGKVDHWFGRLYACTNCAVQIEATKMKLKQIGEDLNSEQKAELQRNLDEWVGIAAELEATDGEFLARVVKAVSADADPEKAIQDIGRKYEQNEKETVALVRKVAELCLSGMKATLTEMDITFDTWDWESELLWNGHVEKALAKLAKLPFAKKEGASVALDVNAILDAYSLRKEFGLSESYEVPPVTLARSDGTTLYPTRDIAYSIVKSTDAEKVINVIATEQTLPQLQIRLALFALGEQRAARNQIHYAYGLVELPGGIKTSKRRAHYVALDDVIQQAKARVEQTMAQRKEELGPSEANKTVQNIALGAIRFTLLNINSTKNMTFTWDRVLSLERNSAPFINYAYTRAGSILRKLGDFPENADCSLLTHPLELLLVFKIAQMTDVFCEAADQLKPEELAGYANSIAEKFHEYYEKVDVIHADTGVKNARAWLVRGIQVVVRNSMELLGINVSERM